MLLLRSYLFFLIFYIGAMSAMRVGVVPGRGHVVIEVYTKQDVPDELLLTDRELEQCETALHKQLDGSERAHSCGACGLCVFGYGSFGAIIATTLLALGQVQTPEGIVAASGVIATPFVGCGLMKCFDWNKRRTINQNIARVRELQEAKKKSRIVLSLENQCLRYLDAHRDVYEEQSPMIPQGIKLSLEELNKKREQRRRELGV